MKILKTSQGKVLINANDKAISAPQPSGTVTITTNGSHDVSGKATAAVNVPQGEPIEISTDAGMTAVLTAANVGKAYKYTGTTGTYTNGDIYIVQEDS